MLVCHQRLSVLSRLISPQGVGYHEITCVPSDSVECMGRKLLYSDYREESEEGSVGLREAEGWVAWGWTTAGEWLTYSVVVSQSLKKNKW